MVDVVIAGAGPAGLWTASNLMKKGINDFLILEKDYPGANSVCGGAVNTKYLGNIISQMESINIVEDVLIIFNNKKINLKVSPIGIFRREELEKALVSSIRKEKIRNNSYVTNFKEKKEYVEVFLNNGETIKTRIFIIATGPVSELLKDSEIGVHIKRTNYAIAQRYILDDYYKFPNNIIRFDFSNEFPGYRWIFPFNGGLNIGNGLFLTKNKSVNLLKDIENYANINELPFNKKGLKGSPIPIEPAKYFSSNRVAVIGDSAGMVNPITGGGLTSIFYFANVLSNAIFFSLKKNIPLFDIYEKEIKRSFFYHWIKNLSKYIDRDNVKAYNLFIRFLFQFYFLSMENRIKKGIL